MPVAPITDPLRRVLGDDVRTGAHAERFAVAGVTPRAVVSPSSAAQVAELVMLCRENGWTIVPAGAGTWLHGGRRPPHIDIVLSTERLSAIPEYEPADLTVAVGAGTGLEQLQREVGRHRQFLALDPPGSSAGTVGATFATASAGPLRRSLGTPRDHALGAEVVTGDGRILRLGGRVVKNVAGYDLVRLIVGSHGTLGIITRLHLRLRPLPLRDMTIVVFASESHPLVDLAPIIVARVAPTALELLAPRLSERLLGDNRWALVARMLGNQDAVHDAEHRFGVESGSLAGADGKAASRPRPLISSEGATFWAALRNAEGRARVMVRVAGLPSRLAQTLELAERIAAANVAPVHGEETMIAAHAGDGIIRIWQDNAPARARAEKIAAAVEETRQARAAGRGSVMVTTGAELLAESLDPFGEMGNAITLMRGLKRAFDPDGILAPGRFVV